jgi:hypothetical protein
MQGVKVGSDQLGAELRHAHFAQPQAQVRLVITQFKTMFAQVQKRKWTFGGVIPGVSVFRELFL